MNFRKSFIFSTIFIVSNLAFAQVDSVKIIFASKILTIADYYEDEIKIGNIDYLVNSIKCEFLPNNINSYNVVILKLTIDNKKLHKIHTYNNKIDSLNLIQLKNDEELFGFECEYIIAYNFYWGIFYRLKGFKTNEFYDFYNLISVDILNNIPNFSLPKNPIGRKKRLKNIVLSMIHVEQMNMKELYNTYYSNPKGYPVDKNSCYKRDKNIIFLK